MIVSKTIIEVLFIAGAFWLLHKSRFVIIDYFETADKFNFIFMQLIHLFMLGVYWFTKPLLPGVVLLFFVLQVTLTVMILRYKRQFLAFYKNAPPILDRVISIFYILYFFVAGILSFMFTF